MLPPGCCTLGVTQQSLFVFTASRGGVSSAKTQTEHWSAKHTCPQVTPASPFSKLLIIKTTLRCVTRSGSETPVGSAPTGSEHRERPRRARGSSGHRGVRPHNSPAGRAGWNGRGRSAPSLPFPPSLPLPPPLPQRSPPRAPLGSPSSPRPRDLAGTARPTLARAAGRHRNGGSVRAAPRYRNAPTMG